jgi:hypothetical protein
MDVASDVLKLCAVVLLPTDLGATIVVGPGQMPSGFLPSPLRRLPAFFSKASTVQWPPCAHLCRRGYTKLTKPAFIEFLKRGRHPAFQTSCFLGKVGI